MKLRLIFNKKKSQPISGHDNTFEEQESIDIDQVSKQLKALEKEMKNTDTDLIAFCKELNIATPF